MTLRWRTCRHAATTGLLLQPRRAPRRWPLLLLLLLLLAFHLRLAQQELHPLCGQRVGVTLPTTAAAAAAAVHEGTAGDTASAGNKCNGRARHA